MFAIKIGTSYNKRVPGFGLRLRQSNPFSCANLSIFLEDHTPSRLLHVPAVEAAFDVDIGLSPRFYTLRIVIYNCGAFVDKKRKKKETKSFK